MAMVPSSAESLDFIINHVVLPPKLPQEADDSNTSRPGEQHLLRLLSSEANSYCRQNQRDTHSTTSASGEVWGVITTMLLRCATLVSAQYLSTELLTPLLSELTVDGVSLPCFDRLRCLIC